MFSELQNFLEIIYEIDSRIIYEINLSNNSSKNRFKNSSKNGLHTFRKAYMHLTVNISNFSYAYNLNRFFSFVNVIFLKCVHYTRNEFRLAFYGVISAFRKVTAVNCLSRLKFY